MLVSSGVSLSMGRVIANALKNVTNLGNKVNMTFRVVKDIKEVKWEKMARGRRNRTYLQTVNRPNIGFEVCG